MNFSNPIILIFVFYTVLKFLLFVFFLDFARLRHIRCAYEYGVPQASGKLFSRDFAYDGHLE